MSDTNPIDSSLFERQLNEVFTLHENGDLDRAEALYRQLIDRYPEIWQLHFNCGLLLFEAGRHAEALEFYLGGLKINDGSEDLLFNTAICQKELGLIEDAIHSYRRALDVAPDDIDCWYNLAGCYRTLCQDTPATQIYIKILEDNPRHLPSLNNLAYLTHKSGNDDQARKLYEQILEINPDHVSADYMRAALSGETRHQPPDSYIKEVFDAFADHYDTSLTDTLGYDLPAALLEFYQRFFADREPRCFLDLGCGTGLVGEKFRSLCSSMTGVDISSQMLAAAREKQLYESLHCSEIIEFLKTRHGSCYDLVVSGDVLPYIGELKGLFTEVARIVSESGHFIFSVEHYPSAEPLPVLQKSGRFAHSRNCITDMAGRTGWHIVGQTELDLRREREVWIQGAIYMMSRSTLT